MRLRPLLLLPPLLWGASAPAETPDGEAIARLVNERPRPTHVSRLAVLTLVDSKRTRRERRLRSFSKLQSDARWLAVFALSPPELRRHAFLAHDPFDATRQDDQWYYRPSRRKAVRVPELSRGQPFLGSEFTFEDLKKEDRVEIDEFTWKRLGTEKVEGREHWVVEQVPVSPELARALGYGRIVNHVDPKTLLRRRIEFFDTKLAPLKTFEVREATRVGGYWMVKRIEAVHRKGHRSVLTFSETDTETPIADELFTVRTLEAERIPRPGSDRS